MDEEEASRKARQKAEERFAEITGKPLANTPESVVSGEPVIQESVAVEPVVASSVASAPESKDDVSSEPKVSIKTRVKNVAGSAASSAAGVGIASTKWAAKKANGAQKYVGSHITENYFLLILFALYMFDITNNSHISFNSPLIAYVLPTLVTLLFLLFSVLFPTKLFYGILGIGVLLGALYATGVNLSGSVVLFFTSGFFFVIAYSFILFWAVFMGGLDLKDRKEKLIVTFLTLVVVFGPIILYRFFAQNVVLDFVLVIFVSAALIWYVLLVHPDTKLIQSIKPIFLLVLFILLIFQTGVFSLIMANMSQMSMNIQQPTNPVDGAQDAIKNVINNTKSDVENIKNYATGEYLKGEVTKDPIHTFVGLELLNPYLLSSIYDPDVDKQIVAEARIHSVSLKTDSVPITIKCAGGKKEDIKTTGFIEIEKLNSVTSVNPSSFVEEVLFPQELSCIYSPVGIEKNSTKNQDQKLVFQANTADFKTSASLKNYFIDRELLNARLKNYAEANKVTLNTQQLLNAIGSIPEYQGIPTKTVSYSDEGPAILIMMTKDLPLIGIDNSELGKITLQVAIQNYLPSSENDAKLLGRIEMLKDITITIPSGMSPSSLCTDWVYDASSKISLSSETLTRLNTKVKGIAKTKQLKMPSCQLELTDSTKILLKKDRPNPSTFVGTMTYDYAVQKSFDIKVKQETIKK